MTSESIAFNNPYPCPDEHVAATVVKRTLPVKSLNVLLNLVAHEAGRVHSEVLGHCKGVKGLKTDLRKVKNEVFFFL